MSFCIQSLIIFYCFVRLMYFGCHSCVAGLVLAELFAVIVLSLTFCFHYSIYSSNLQPAFGSICLVFFSPRFSRLVNLIFFPTTVMYCTYI